MYRVPDSINGGHHRHGGHKQFASVDRLGTKPKSSIQRGSSQSALQHHHSSGSVKHGSVQSTAPVHAQKRDVSPASMTGGLQAGGSPTAEVPTSVPQSASTTGMSSVGYDEPVPPAQQQHQPSLSRKGVESRYKEKNQIERSSRKTKLRSSTLANDHAYATLTSDTPTNPGVAEVSDPNKLFQLLRKKKKPTGLSGVPPTQPVTSHGGSAVGTGGNVPSGLYSQPHAPPSAGWVSSKKEVFDSGTRGSTGDAHSNHQAKQEALGSSKLVQHDTTPPRHHGQSKVSSMDTRAPPPPGPHTDDPGAQHCFTISKHNPLAYKHPLSSRRGIAEQQKTASTPTTQVSAEPPPSSSYALPSRGGESRKSERHAAVATAPSRRSNFSASLLSLDPGMLESRYDTPVAEKPQHKALLSAARGVMSLDGSPTGPFPSETSDLHNAKAGIISTNNEPSTARSVCSPTSARDRDETQQALTATKASSRARKEASARGEFDYGMMQPPVNRPQNNSFRPRSRIHPSSAGVHSSVVGERPVTRQKPPRQALDLFPETPPKADTAIKDDDDDDELFPMPRRDKGEAPSGGGSHAGEGHPKPKASGVEEGINFNCLFVHDEFEMDGSKEFPLGKSQDIPLVETDWYGSEWVELGVTETDVTGDFGPTVRPTKKSTAERESMKKGSRGKNRPLSGVYDDDFDEDSGDDEIPTEATTEYYGSLYDMLVANKKSAA